MCGAQRQYGGGHVRWTGEVETGRLLEPAEMVQHGIAVPVESAGGLGRALIAEITESG